MAKVECFTPDGKMEMKEPVDAKECVENCGFTMEAPGSKGESDVAINVVTAGVNLLTKEVTTDVSEIKIPRKVDGRRKKRNK